MIRAIDDAFKSGNVRFALRQLRLDLGHTPDATLERWAAFDAVKAGMRHPSAIQRLALAERTRRASLEA